LRNPALGRHNGAVAGLLKFRRKHKLTLCSIRDLIAHRRSRELVEREQAIALPTAYGDFEHMYARCSMTASPRAREGTVSTKKRRSCAFTAASPAMSFARALRLPTSQLQNALQQIEAAAPACSSMRQEGRGIGLPARFTPTSSRGRARHGRANLKLGFPATARLRTWRADSSAISACKMRFLTNNPKKVVGFSCDWRSSGGANQGAFESAQRGLETKRVKMGHLPEGKLQGQSSLKQAERSSGSI
jgi:3,4-dihydroxy 2-butanone 4-phosphate synthase/GTP cyclohydrolase II